MAWWRLQKGFVKIMTNKLKQWISQPYAAGKKKRNEIMIWQEHEKSMDQCCGSTAQLNDTMMDEECCRGNYKTATVLAHLSSLLHLPRPLHLLHWDNRQPWATNTADQGARHYLVQLFSIYFQPVRGGGWKNQDEQQQRLYLHPPKKSLSSKPSLYLCEWKVLYDYL